MIKITLTVRGDQYFVKEKLYIYETFCYIDDCTVFYTSIVKVSYLFPRVLVRYLYWMCTALCVYWVFKWQSHCGKKDGSLQIVTPCQYMVPSSLIWYSLAQPLTLPLSILPMSSLLLGHLSGCTRGCLCAGPALATQIIVWSSGTADCFFEEHFSHLLQPGFVAAAQWDLPLALHLE